MQGEQKDDRGTNAEATGKSEPSELLRKCVQTYSTVTTLRPDNETSIRHFSASI